MKKSGGVAILLTDGFQGKIIETLSSGIGRWIISVILLDNNFFIMVNIDGFNNSSNNKTLLDGIVLNVSNLKLKYPSAFILFGGDFNEAPNLVDDRFPPRTVSNSTNPLIGKLCQRLNLIDAHRYLHPDNHMYTWFKSLISDSLISYLTSAEISPSPLTDHAAIYIHFSDTKFKQRRKVTPGYWKLNCSFLLSDSYCQGIMKIAENLISQANISAISKWELFKYESRKFPIKFGKNSVS